MKKVQAVNSYAKGAKRGQANNRRVTDMRFVLVLYSGRADSNRRRPAWEAGILPLNYARNSEKRRFHHIIEGSTTRSSRSFCVS